MVLRNMIGTSTLGLAFEELGLSKSQYVEDFIDDDGLEPKWSISLLDEPIEFFLNIERKVVTAFISSRINIENLIGCSTLSSKEEIISLNGMPSKQGHEFVDEFIGSQGAWIRYDYPTYCLHIQFYYGKLGVRMVTLMSAGHAP